MRRLGKGSIRQLKYPAIFTGGHRAVRDVTAGATGATAVAPKFSDALTLFQPGGADSALPLQRSHHKFPRDYVSGSYSI